MYPTRNDLPESTHQFRGHHTSEYEFLAGWPQGIAPLGLPQIRTCTFAHTAPHIMSSLRDGSLGDNWVSGDNSVSVVYAALRHPE